MKRVLLASGVCLGVFAFTMANSTRVNNLGVTNNISQNDTTKKPVDSTKQFTAFSDTTKKDTTKAYLVAFSQDTTKKPTDSTKQFAIAADTTKKDTTKAFMAFASDTTKKDTTKAFNNTFAFVKDTTKKPLDTTKQFAFVAVSDTTKKDTTKAYRMVAFR